MTTIKNDESLLVYQFNGGFEHLTKSINLSSALVNWKEVETDLTFHIQDSFSEHFSIESFKAKILDD